MNAKVCRQRRSLVTFSLSLPCDLPLSRRGALLLGLEISGWSKISEFLLVWSFVNIDKRRKAGKWQTHTGKQDVDFENNSIGLLEQILCWADCVFQEVINQALSPLSPSRRCFTMYQHSFTLELVPELCRTTKAQKANHVLPLAIAILLRRKQSWRSRRIARTFARAKTRARCQA